MSTPKIILTFVFSLLIFISYSQSSMSFSEVNQPTINNYLHQSNLVIENMLLEVTMLDWTKDDHKKILALTNNYLVQNNRHPSTFKNSKATHLFKEQGQPFIAFSNLENRLKGTVSVHQLPERYPQVESTIPSNLSIPAPINNRPKSFGALHKF